MADTIKCTHCGNKRPALGFAPFPNVLGQRIATEICQPCWSEWLQKQTQIINHYGLDLTNPDAQNFLFDNIKGFLFGDAPQLAQIDASGRIREVVGRSRALYFELGTLNFSLRSSMDDIKYLS